MTFMIRLEQGLKIARSFVRCRVGCPKPFFVSYQITLRCNRKCVFCNVWRQKTYRELDTVNAKGVIDELAECDVEVLGITGGEPLMRTDLEEIAAYARRKGLIVGVNTNGTLLTAKRAESIANVFDTVFVSLDGFEETHDAIRGEKGTFREALAGLKNLVKTKKDCTVGVNFVLNKMNYKEFVPFCRWISDLGVLVTLFPVGGDEGSVAEYSIPASEVDVFVHQVLQERAVNSSLGPSEKVLELIPRYVKGEMPHICDAGRLYLGVSPTGELRICPIGPDSPDWQIGSLIDRSMAELMSTRRFRQVLSARKDCTPCLAGCTTPYSLLFKGSAKELTEEALSYFKSYRQIVKKRARGQSFARTQERRFVV
jgi:MoaA/NifB/PqqE/SkfB family radical SAM enzyme